MKNPLAIAGLIVISVLSLTLMPSPLGPTDVNAQVTGRLEVWNDVYGSNITNFGLTQITVEVNVTGAGPINGFDVTMRYYNLTIGSTVLDAVGSTANLSGGLFDPDNPPQPCPQVFVSKNEVDAPPGIIRVTATLFGGCTVENGTLFTLTFDVVGVGAAAIEIIQTDTGGSPETLLASSGRSVPYDAFGAIFRNKPGVSPVADFTRDPFTPRTGDTVTFDGTSSFDPSNPTGPGRGIRRWLWEFGDGTGRFENTTVPIIKHRFIAPPSTPLSGNFTVRLIVYDFDNGLAAVKTAVVHVSIRDIHDIAVSMSTSVNELRQGETLQLTVIVTNNGNKDEIANVTVTYSYQNETQVGKESGLSLTRLGSDRQKTFHYSLETSALPVRGYTVTARGVIVNATTGGIITDFKPGDNISTTNFTLVSPTQESSLTLPIVGAAAVVVIVGAWLGLRVMRRRKVEE